eukprot:scaffold3411_cov396-Prasinococcus_capsulatus_cf.AAC.1
MARPATGRSRLRCPRWCGGGPMGRGRRARVRDGPCRRQGSRCGALRCAATRRDDSSPGPSLRRRA